MTNTGICQHHGRNATLRGYGRGGQNEVQQRAPELLERQRLSLNPEGQLAVLQSQRDCPQFEPHYDASESCMLEVE